MIAVIIDSPEAENAARSLSERLQAKGNDTVLLDSGSYIAGKICADKTIVIGHDLLAEMKLRSIPALGYDIYGMKYGFKGDVCVLSAQRNLNFKEQTDFLIYADNRLRYYQSCGIKTEKYISPNTREDDIGRATREFMSEMKEWYCDGDNSASGIAIKTGLTVAFSPLIALVGVGGLLAAACQSGSAAIDRYEILKMQYQLLSLEFETQDSQHFLKQPKKQMKTANASVKPRAEYIKPKSHIMPGMPAFDELDRLVGLENVKRTVKEIVIFLRKRGKNAVPCLHMVFRGNPGTAKTTVARMIARIFYESGITEKNLLVETGRAGLIGGYVGQTALKTEKQINKSLGGVLFIDEAYSLFTGDNQDYGNEAVATLVKAMEDKRDKFICIMAGYTDKTNSMIDMNPGLRDRVQFYIDFPDYTDADLLRIFEGLCKNKRYKLSESARAAISAEFTRLIHTKSENFSNGRLVRKVFERVCIKQAQRSDDSTITEKDIEAAFAEPDIAAMCKSAGTKIGFV